MDLAAVEQACLDDGGGAKKGRKACACCSPVPTPRTREKGVGETVLVVGMRCVSEDMGDKTNGKGKEAQEVARCLPLLAHHAGNRHSPPPFTHSKHPKALTHS